jgi:DNA-binding NarL/FixJ family response regulator
VVRPALGWRLAEQRGMPEEAREIYQRGEDTASAQSPVHTVRLLLAHGRLVGKGLSNPEIAAELFISRKAVEYHLGNIYAICGVQGRQQLRRFVGQWRQPAAV